MGFDINPKKLVCEQGNLSYCSAYFIFEQRSYLGHKLGDVIWVDRNHLESKEKETRVLEKK